MKAHVALIAAIGTLILAGSSSAATMYAPAYYGPADDVYAFALAPDGGLTSLLGSPFNIGSPLPNARGIGSMAFTPDGSRAVVGYYFNGGIQGLAVAASGAVSPAQAVVGADRGMSAAVSPDGRFAYQAIAGSTKGIAAYSIAADGSLTALAGSPFASSSDFEWLTVAPDGKRLYATDGTGITPFTIAPDGALTAGSDFNSVNPGQIEFSPDGRFIFYSTSPLNVGTLAVAADGSLSPVGSPVTVGTTSGGIAIAPDSARLYGVDYNGSTLGDSKYSINVYAIGPDGSLAFVAAAPTAPLRCRWATVAPDMRHIYAACGNGKIGVAEIGANGVPGPFREAADWPSGEPVPFVFRPAFGGVASFKRRVASKPLTIAFEGAASTAPNGTVDAFSWDFGDGGSASQSTGQVTHTFSKAGVYNVRLTVSSEGCADKSIYDGHTTLCNGSAAAARTVAVDTPPWITSLKLSPSRVGSKTRIKFKLTEAATVTFAVQKPTTGRNVNGSCKKQTRSNKQFKKCTRWVTVGKKFTAKGKSRKTNSVKFTGSVKGRKLPAGSYRLSAVGKDKAKGLGPARTARFRIAR